MVLGKLLPLTTGGASTRRKLRPQVLHDTSFQHLLVEHLLDALQLVLVNFYRQALEQTNKRFRDSLRQEWQNVGHRLAL